MKRILAMVAVLALLLAAYASLRRPAKCEEKILADETTQQRTLVTPPTQRLIYETDLVRIEIDWREYVSLLRESMRTSPPNFDNTRNTKEIAQIETTFQHTNSLSIDQRYNGFIGSMIDEERAAIFDKQAMKYVSSIVKHRLDFQCSRFDMDGRTYYLSTDDKERKRPFLDVVDRIT